MAKSRITFPNGTVVEIDKDTSPQQIQAIITALTGGLPQESQKTNKVEEQQPGEIIEPRLSIEELWEQGSKKEKLAIFIRNQFMPSDWFTTKEVRDQQLAFVKKFIFGESPQIATYLNRLHEEGYLDKSKRGKYIHYQLRSQLQEEYPELHLEQMSNLLRMDQ